MLLRVQVKPIGVFDSGLGGLTVLKTLSSQLPFENFIYLGDVARLPYGTKSPAVVQRYAKNCAQFLYSHEVKLVVVACNTATAIALPSLQSESSVPVMGVIAPGARAGLAASPRKRILVLGTESTVRSEAYSRAFYALDKDAYVEQLACPLLVPLAEAGWFDHRITHEVIRQYLPPEKISGFDAIVLGCTHYPLLLPSFRAVLGDGIALVNGAQFLAEEVQSSLPKPTETHSGGNIRFFATDQVHSALPLLKTIFGKPIEFELVDL